MTGKVKPEMTRLNALIGAVFVATTSIGAQPQHRVYGPGAVSCGKFLSESADIQTGYEFWVLGYVSAIEAINSAMNKPLQATDSAGMFGFIRKYCAEHPLDQFELATRMLVGRLRQQ